MKQPIPASAKPVLSFTRYWFYLAAFLDFVIGFELFILANHTDYWFAWTINPPLTAAFLGASYWAGFFLVILASQKYLWERARIAIPGVLVFAILTLIATLMHIDKFHFGSEFAFLTQGNTWTWLIVYIAAPLIMIAALLKQKREPGKDMEQNGNLPTFYRGLLAILSGIMVLPGIALFVVPASVSSLWPWTLSALTARSVGAWLVGIGLVAGQMAWENHWEKIRIGLVALIAFGVLQLIAVLRFYSTIHWDTFSAPIYVVFLLATTFIGIYGLRKSLATRKSS